MRRKVRNYTYFALEILILVFRKCNMTPFFIQVIHFITSLEGSHSGLAERIPVSQNRATCLNIFRLLCFMLTCSKAVA